MVVFVTTYVRVNLLYQVMNVIDGVMSKAKTKASFSLCAYGLGATNSESLMVHYS